MQLRQRRGIDRRADLQNAARQPPGPALRQPQRDIARGQNAGCPGDRRDPRQRLVQTMPDRPADSREVGGDDRGDDAGNDNERKGRRHRVALQHALLLTVHGQPSIGVHQTLIGTAPLN